MVVSQNINAIVAGTEHGRKYGYSLKKDEFPKMSGNFSAGRSKKPPMSGLVDVRHTLQASDQTAYEPSGSPQIPRRRKEAECIDDIC